MGKLLLSNRTKTIITWSFNIALLVLLLLVMSKQLLFNNNAATIFNKFLSSFHDRRASYLCLAIGLIPFNLAFETLKWLQFTRSFCKISFREAYRAVLAGFALGIVTPNRVGEYGGRLLLIPAEYRWQAGVAMLLGSYCQWIVLFFGGLVGFCWFAYNYFNWQAYILRVILVGGNVACLGLVIGLLQIGRILPLIEKCGLKRGGRRWHLHLEVLRAASLPARFRALQWAGLRYVTYSVQYWLLMLFFGIKMPMIAAFAGIATIFLMQTGIPLSAGLALLARGEIAIYVWGFLGANEISVLAATFGLFVINLLLPALLGTIFIIYKKAFKIIRL